MDEATEVMRLQVRVSFREGFSDDELALDRSRPENALYGSGSMFGARNLEAATLQTKNKSALQILCVF